MGHTVGRPLKTWSLGLSNKFPARGVPGEGPDCHVPKVIVRFKPIPARILKFSIFILALSSRSLLRKMACLKKTSVPENTWRVARVHEISLHRSLLVRGIWRCCPSCPCGLRRLGRGGGSGGWTGWRGQFAPLWALAKRLSGRGTSKGLRALPVILLPDGSVAQSELAAMEALAAVFVADFGAGAQRVTIADLQEQLDALVGAE